MHPWISLAALVLVTVDGSASYERAWEEALELERSGELEASLAAIDAHADRYAQDYALVTRRAWLNYQLGRFEQAEILYRTAVELSGGTFEARLGLGWTLVSLGRMAEARAIFETLIVEQPNHALVQQGLDLTIEKPRRTWAASFVGTLHSYSAHPDKTLAGGITAGLRVRPFSSTQIGAYYRGSYFSIPGNGQGNGQNASSDDSFTQHEAYVQAGYDGARLTILGHFAYVSDGSVAALDTTVGGVSATVRVFGEASVSATWSHYSDTDVIRGVLAWRIPLGARWAITPGASVQRTNTEWLGNGTLTVSLVHGLGSIWVMGKYGDEVRPVYLEQPSTYNIPERINYGGRAGVSFDLGPDWLTFGEYELHHLTDSADESVTSFLHLFSIGMSRRF